ncbi:MAG: hypothetical protein WDW36_009764 [Sanguina aurantia]
MGRSSHRGSLTKTPAFNSTANLSQEKPSSYSGVTEDSAEAADGSARSSLNISFDDTSDAECTVITIEGQDQSHLLMSLTTVFITSGLNVVTASITSEEGRINDVFRVQTPEGTKLPESLFEEVRRKILDVTSSSSRSNKPAIYGIIAAAEVERLRPLAGVGAYSEVQALELSAAEMAQAAAELVSRERGILALREAKNPDARLIAAQEAGRAEAAAVLERRMAAMEAVMAARRSAPPPSPPTP